jgi:dihydroceramide fatty acyl 2-hydroxylase
MWWKATPESPRMFESDLVDAFSRVPWYFVPLLYVPVILGCVAWSVTVAGASPAVVGAQVFGGWVVWTLLEYWLHRTLFHWVPDAPWGERFHFLLHGVHHTWYQDRYRLVMPPAASLSVAVVVWAMLWGVAELASPVLAPSWRFGLFAGITLGYTVYDCTHYYIHHAKPKSRIGLALRAHHNKHHHNAKYKDKKFGVSITVWDHVFGTFE